MINLHLGVEPSFCALELLNKGACADELTDVQTEIITDGPFGSLFEEESFSPLMVW